MLLVAVVVVAMHHAIAQLWPLSVFFINCCFVVDFVFFFYLRFFIYFVFFFVFVFNLEFVVFNLPQSMAIDSQTLLDDGNLQQIRANLGTNSEGDMWQKLSYLFKREFYIIKK